MALVKITKTLAAKGGRTTGHAVGLEMAAETEGHKASKNKAIRFSPFALRERPSGN
jgi:hypothetical protein